MKIVCELYLLLFAAVPVPERPQMALMCMCPLSLRKSPLPTPPSGMVGHCQRNNMYYSGIKNAANQPGQEKPIAAQWQATIQVPRHCCGTSSSDSAGPFQHLISIHLTQTSITQKNSLQAQQHDR